MPRLLLVCAFALAAPALHAATSAVAITPQAVSVPGGETRVFSARFFGSSGQAAVNEPVQFVNDACGTFANGSPVITVNTDSTGTASAAFTARNQGITCWIAASAGPAQARWDVLTFPTSLVHFQATLWPPQPRPGERFTVTVTPMAGAYRLYEAEFTARVLEGTASASLSSTSLHTGQAGRATLEVVPDHRVGSYDIEFRYKDRIGRVPLRAPDPPWQDMWWGGPAESGWGVSIVQHRDTLFNVIYAHDAAGKPTWYVMPGGEWNADRTRYTGALYSPRGTPFTAYDAARLEVGAAVGTASLTFAGGNDVRLEYTVGERRGMKALSRQPYAIPDTPLIASFADMWWGGAQQSGWGIALLQHYRTLFGVWFTYDAEGAPTWFVMPSGSWADALTYQGRIYRASGADFLAPAYDSRAFRTTDVGSFVLRFTGDEAVYDYTIDGRSGTMRLSRQPF